MSFTTSTTTSSTSTSISTTGNNDALPVHQLPDMNYDAATDEEGHTIGVLAPSSSKPVVLEEPNEDNGVGSPMAITAAPEHVGCFTLTRMEVFLRNRIIDNPRGSTLVRVHSKADMTPLECAGICAGGGSDGFAVSRGDLFTCLSEGDSGGFLRGRGNGVCNSPCTGDASQTCGGHAAFDAYKIVSRGDDENADGIALGDSPSTTDTAATSTTARKTRECGGFTLTVP
ncbi:unnamed protein product [Ectocarpus sp. CCAP 1310/34]|nr:unnamed protein product [Ectocarpus sp. CCAP 1310/34]